MHSSQLVWQSFSVTKEERVKLKGRKPICIWLTGLSASGKSTIANLLEAQLLEQGVHTYLLDGDNVRHGLNKDLGFSETDREENVRRVAEVAWLMVDAGLVTIVSFISPFKQDRLMARSLFEPGEFIEVFVDTPLHVCEQRDPKGFYAKAREGKIDNFTGVSSPYEPPVTPEVHLYADAQTTPDQSVAHVLGYLNNAN